VESWLEPVLDAARMREIDRWAIEERGVPSLELMEAAGASLADAARAASGPGPIRIVCGKGNNGGDGFVAARHLSDHGAEALMLFGAEELTDDARSNFERCPSARQVSVEELGEALKGSGAIVDALLGTGFEGATREPVAGAIEAINSAGAPVIAADIPSGVDASTGEVVGSAVRAGCTVAFHAPKLGHHVTPGKRLTGALTVADIGVPEGAPHESAAGLIGAGVLSGAPRRQASSTKFSSGQVLLVGGSRGLTGAITLASAASIRAGAGYATACVPASLEPILEVKLTEVMTRGCEEDEGALVPGAAGEILEAGSRAAAVVLGPGLGRSPGAAELSRDLAQRLEAPLVIDADALNALGGTLETLRGRPAPTILTPHAGELGKLLDRDSDAVAASRLACAGEAAERSGAIVVLKGDDTLVVGPAGDGGSRVAVNTLSSPALATAGTGDVLSGTIAALIARGMEPFAAASAGVLAHARAGRIAAERLGAEAVIASDVIDALPDGLRPEGS